MPIFDDRFESGGLDGESGRRLRTVEDLRVGDSACFIYDGASEYQAVVVPFVKAGFVARQRVVYVHHVHAPGEVSTMLAANGVDVDRAQARGQLAFLPAAQMYARGADHSLDRVLDQLHAMTAMALADGWSALRVTSEMSWALCQTQGTERLLEQERRVAAFFRGGAVLGMTQLERGRFPAGALLDVLLAHPLAVVGTQAVYNFYHAPHGEDPAAWRSQATLETWLSNLKDRHRATECLRETLRLQREVLDDISSDEQRQRAWRSKVVERLAGGVAHDMNNALNAIIAFADLALLGAGEDDGLRADIGEIREAAGRAADITRRLLAFSRRHSPKQRVIALNSARSEVGKGTCAEIYLQRLTGDDDSDSAEGAAGRETVLLVEDEDLVRRVVARVLARAGYRVLIAGGGAEALDLCESMGTPIDLLVTDVVMPGMDGKELAALVARRFPSIKILFMTGYTDEATLREEILDHGRGIMLKPFSPEELLEKTREVLDE
jgi:CheY-like chemotaxis protein